MSRASSRPERSPARALSNSLSISSTTSGVALVGSTNGCVFLGGDVGVSLLTRSPRDLSLGSSDLACPDPPLQNV